MEEKDTDKLKGDESPEEAMGEGGEKKPGEGAGEGESGEKKGPGVAFPPADFANFILSLSASALMHLGDLKNPATDKLEKDPLMAKHTIDILAMLKEKTKGNLKDDESKLIENVLHDLRIRYVKAVGQADKTGE